MITRRLPPGFSLNLILWVVGGGLLLLVVWGSASTLIRGTYSAKHWVDFMIFGVAQGSVYALIALGYTLVYGILKMINFAHGEVFMSGAFTAYFAANTMEQSGFLQSQPVVGILVLFVVSMATSTLVAILLERIAYRPLRRAQRLVPLITAIGASFFLQYTFRGLYGSGVKSYPDMDVLKGYWVIGPVEILKTQAVVIVAAAIMMSGLYWFVQKTKMGRAMRAVSENKEVAALMGINVDRVIVTAFTVGAAMAGAAGVLYALMYKQVHFFMGFLPGIKAFTAAVLGGIGNIPGAMVGGLFLGIFESVGPALFLDGLGIPAPYQLKDVIAFTMLVFILVFRPTGILGEKLAEKKA